MKVTPTKNHVSVSSRPRKVTACWRSSFQRIAIRCSSDSSFLKNFHLKLLYDEVSLKFRNFGLGSMVMVNNFVMWAVTSGT